MNRDARKTRDLTSAVSSCRVIGLQVAVILFFLTGCDKQTSLARPAKIHGKKIKTTYNAKVVGIVDGDTCDVLTADNQQIRIRLDSIDCPDRKQPFYNRAKQHLSGLIYGQNVTVYETGSHFDRKLAFIDDINERMVADGFAWNAVRYSKSERLAELEQMARDAKIGLWIDDSPIPPWEWRKR